ncbi:endolytic transglycosylase MltG [Bacillota bacterium]
MHRIKSKRRFLSFILALATVFVIALLMFFNSWLAGGSGPLLPGSTDLVSITIARGSVTKTIGQQLEATGLISDSLVFRVKSRLDGLDGKYQAGDYSLSPGMSMNEIMEMLLSGHSDTTRFTIPEGYDIRRTADTLESARLIDRSTFMRELAEGDFDYWFINDLGKGENRLEGYLFPETYEIYVTANEHDIIDKMLSQFNNVITDEHINRMKELGKDMNEVLVLASIIEREALVSEDRPVIAGVFLNRLKSGMPLQSCATVQYILGEQKPVLSTADTQTESPYNTYLHTGLPPTPICSPGIESINAALWPVDTDYLYFLAKGDGSHVFSKTYEEHLRNKAKYID